MATRVAKLLDAVTDPSTKAAHSELCFKHAKEAAQGAMRLAPYSVTDSEALTLERMGITTSPFATTSHTHASDKILENDCLATIGHYLPKDAVTFIQLKKGKLHLLNRGPRQDFLANYCHEPKDVLRYGITNPYYCPKVTTQTAVIADTLHFMSTRQLTQLFLSNPRLETLFATLVLPIEALHRLPSLFPDVYRLEYYKNHFAYMPGGHGGGAYVHSYETLKWLSTGQVGKSAVNPRFNTTDYISIEKIETKAAHHIMLITRRRANVPWPLTPLWVFHPSDFVKLPHVFYPPTANVQNTYPHDLIKRMQTYCFSVKAVSLRDIFAKLRQVIETAELKRYSMADLIRLANYLLLITGMEQVADYECLLTKGWLAKLSCRIRTRVRQLFESLRGKTSYAALLTVTDVIPVPFTTTPCIRECDGISWLTEELPNPEPFEPGPTLEDLELMGELHKMQNFMSGTEPDPIDQPPECYPEGSTHHHSEPTQHDAQPHGVQGTSSRAQDPPQFPTANSQEAKVQSHRQSPIRRGPTTNLPHHRSWRKSPGWDAFTHPATSDSECDDASTYNGSISSDYPESEPQNEQPNKTTDDTSDPTTTMPDVDPSMYEAGSTSTEHVPQAPLTEATRGPNLQTEARNPELQAGKPEKPPRATPLASGPPESLFTFGTITPEVQQNFPDVIHSTASPTRAAHHHPRPGRTGNSQPKTQATTSGSSSAGAGAPPVPTPVNKGKEIAEDSPRSSSGMTNRANPQAPRAPPPETLPTPTPMTHAGDARDAPMPSSDTPAAPQTPPNCEDAPTDRAAQADLSQTVSQLTTTYPHLSALEVSILIKHGFTNLKQQFSGSGPIQPIFLNPLAQNFLVSPATTPSQRIIASVADSIYRKIYAYSIDNKRATAYMSDVKNNLTGLVLPKLNRDTLTAWVSLSENTSRQVKLLVIHGAGGAGKSRCLQTMLRDHPQLANDINVITPTVNLVVDWRQKNPTIDSRRFITFEKACEREGREIVIFDDYGKLPAGYIDAYLAIKPTVEMIILTGDQRQSTHHCANRDAQTANLPTNVAHFRRYCDYYLNATHRQPRRLANPIEVHAEKEIGGAVAHANLIPEGCTALVPSHRTQTVLADLGRTTYTYSGCQGLTLPNVTIVLDPDTPLCSPEVLYTAFSRASSTITFVNTHSDHPQFLQKLDATPYLKTLISGVREDENVGRDQAPAEHVAPTPNVKTHLPVENDRTFLEPKVEAVDDKDVRELWDGQEKTNLMQTQDPVVQLFPHQQAKDEALFKITIDKRIRKATVDENTKAIIGRLHAGDLLFEAYAKFMRVPKEPQRFDKELWVHCRQLALRTYLSKPKNNLIQGAARQDPDFPENAIALFNKSQWVKKLEKVGFPFKAGQTISAFKQSTVLLTTTMALYLRKKREAHQPENVFIMCEKTPAEFNTFVLNRFDFSQDSYTSDYEQYDQSQDASFLNFELRKAKHLGIPDAVTDFYRFIKTHAKTFVGNLAIMRLSGEGPTFDANTECNIAYDALRFQLDDTVNACYAGDDLVRDRVCPERASWVFSQHLFSLTAKPQSTTKPDFCGWRLTPYGIVKNPTQLYQSLQLALRLNKIEDVKRSYAIDYTHAYRLQDRLFEIFDEQEMAAHHLTTRLLIKFGVTNAQTGDHLPMFHVTSDRLIQDPNAVTITDSESSRSLIEQPNFIDHHFHDDHTAAEHPRESSQAAAQYATIPRKTFPKLIWLDGTPLN